MSGFVLHPEAYTDLDEIWEYIEADNLDAADRVLEEIYQTLRSLASMFSDVWLAIEEILAALLSSQLVPGAFMAEIPEEKRDPQVPKRFAFGWSGPPLGQ